MDPNIQIIQFCFLTKNSNYRQSAISHTYIQLHSPVDLFLHIINRISILHKYSNCV